MKLNGWIRLWIVLSVCWAIPVGYFAYSDISNLYLKKRFEVSRENIGSAEFLFSAKQSDFAIENQLKNDLIPLIYKNPEKYVDKTDASPYETYIAENSSKTLLTWFMMLILPPTLLFLGGWSVSWVRRGFKQKNEA